MRNPKRIITIDASPPPWYTRLWKRAYVAVCPFCYGGPDETPEIVRPPRRDLEVFFDEHAFRCVRCHASGKVLKTQILIRAKN